MNCCLRGGTGRDQARRPQNLSQKERKAVLAADSYEYSKMDPPTYACVGEMDGIVNWKIMQSRLEGMSRLGIATEFHHYPGLPHGFGLGRGTVAEGWIDEAIAFWEKQMK